LLALKENAQAASSWYSISFIELSLPMHVPFDASIHVVDWWCSPRAMQMCYV
jgi:hypothetical protein